jgi:hypothetical protein
MISGGTDMTLETEINEESNFRIHSLTGNFEFDELFEALVGVYDDENFDPDLNSVWDLIDVKGIEKTSTEQIQKIVAYVSWKREKYGGMKTALVVSNRIHYGIARMYEQSLEAAAKSEIMVFRDLESAIQWIS